MYDTFMLLCTQKETIYITICSLSSVFEIYGGIIMNNPSQSIHWTHRAASIFQIIFGIVGFIAALVFILPIARPIITVFLCILCIYELLLGIMNLSLLNKKSYSRFLKPCAQFLDHYQHSGSSRKN